MRKCLFSLLAVCSLTFVVGCGGHKAQVVDTQISDEDQKTADETIQQYGSAEYAESQRPQQ